MDHISWGGGIGCIPGTGTHRLILEVSTIPILSRAALPLHSVKYVNFIKVSLGLQSVRVFLLLGLSISLVLLSFVIVC